MKLKKMLTLALAVLFAFAAAFPVGAITGTESHSTTYYGANVSRQGKARLHYVSASMTLTFEDGYSPLPLSDYSCRACVVYYGLDGGYLGRGNGPVGNLSSSVSKDVQSNTTTKVEFVYYIFDTDWQYDTPVYIDTLL
jgi:hypothetical protein